MIHFELLVAVTLAVSACSSLFAFYLAREKEGKVQLPIHADEFGDGVQQHDPFDVVTPIDLIDGHPINADAFWALVSCVNTSSHAAVQPADCVQ